MKNAPHPKPCNGFSLIDIMVGMVVGLLTMLAIMQSFAAFEGQKRTTTNGMEAQENGLIALHALETDIRQAGYGLTTSGSLACTGINTYNSTATPTTPPTAPLIPIQINDSYNGTLSDAITATYSTSATGGVPASIVTAMPDSSAVLTVNTGNGFNVGDVLLLSTPGSTLPCSRVVVTAVQAQANGVNLIHNSGLSNYNPPGGSNIFPLGGYSPPSVVFNMGAMVQNQYQVLCSSLAITNLSTAAGAPACTTNPSSFTNAAPLSGNIVNIQAQYGIAAPPAGNQSVNCWTDAVGTACSGTNWAAPPAADVARIKAIRVAVVARSSLMERPATPGGVCTTTTVAPVSWTGGPAIDLSADPNWKCYRYKVYQTIIPLRNILWANL